MLNNRVPFYEKVAYALGDASANIAWRAQTMFLMIFYTDVFGITPATVAIMAAVVRVSDGVSDIGMGIIGDRTRSKYGRFRPWILWTAIPLAVILSLMFTTPDWSMEWKVAYAFVTYLLFTLIYTANNIPYGALLAVMSPDEKERTSIGSFRMIGAFTGGLIVQGSLIFLVAYFGNVNPNVNLTQTGESKYLVEISVPEDFSKVSVQTKDKVATFVLNDAAPSDSAMSMPSNSKSLPMTANQTYAFTVEGEKDLTPDSFSIIDQTQGYSNAVYLLSGVLALCLFITFKFTKERVTPPASQKTNLKEEVKDLFKNKPWLILVSVGLAFNIYNSIKQGTVMYYFTHYLDNQILASLYMTILMLASIAGAFTISPICSKFGKKNVFIFALFATGLVNSLLAFCDKDNITEIFIIGSLSELLSAIPPTLFFTMLADTADYSEYKFGRRATGLIYSACSFVTKFSGALAAFVIGGVLSYFNYDSSMPNTIKEAVPGIIMLMSWLPAIIACVGGGLMFLYPLTKDKMDIMAKELAEKKNCEA
ncbi:MAG: MFS transporter [Paludibacteraceae bacterium]|nr:MFS transporter [Paludibacteraceae bacterium]